MPRIWSHKTETYLEHHCSHCWLWNYDYHTIYAHVCFVVYISNFVLFLLTASYYCDAKVSILLQLLWRGFQFQQCRKAENSISFSNLVITVTTHNRNIKSHFEVEETSQEKASRRVSSQGLGNIRRTFGLNLPLALTPINYKSNFTQTKQTILVKSLPVVFFHWPSVTTREIGWTVLTRWNFMSCRKVCSIEINCRCRSQQLAVRGMLTSRP